MEIECVCCFDDIPASGIIQMQVDPSLSWLCTNYCEECFRRYYDGRWEAVKKSLYDVDCYAALKRLLSTGLQTHFHESDFIDVEDDAPDRIVVNFRKGDDGETIDGCYAPSDVPDLAALETELQDLVNNAPIVAGKPDISQEEIHEIYHMYFI